MSTYSDKFFADKAVGALWDVAVSIKRGNPLPLDKDSVVHGIAELNAIAAGAVSYPGQIIAVIEDAVYEGEGEEQVLVKAESTTLYYLDHNKEPKEVGKVPVGDELSIDVVDEKISLHDFGKAFYKYNTETKEYSRVEVSSENPWKAGLEPKVATVDSKLVLAWYEPNPTTIDGVNAQVAAIQGTVADLVESVGTPGDETTESTGLYKEIDTVEGEVESVKGDVADIQEALNGTEEVDGLIDKVASIEEELPNKANAADVYTKAETESLIASAGHLKREIVEALPEVSAADKDTIYMIKDASIGSDEDAYAEYMLIGEGFEKIGDTRVDLSEYAKSADVTKEIEEAVKDFATDEEVGAAIVAGLAGYAKTSEVTDAIADAIAPLAVKQEVEDALALKADASALDSLATKQELSDGLADKVTSDKLAEELAIYAKSKDVTDALALKVDKSAYDEKVQAIDNSLAAKLDIATWEAELPGLATEAEVAALIGEAPVKNEESGEYEGATGIYTNIYTKDEVTQLIADITGGESAADVLAALNAYKTSTDPRIKALENSVNGVPADEANGIPAAMGLLDRVSELETLAKIKSVSNEFTLIDGALGVNSIAASKVTGLSEAIGVATSEKLGLVKSASGDNKVSVDADGIMSVSAVNVDSLTQTEGQELILNGGGAQF